MAPKLGSLLRLADACFYTPPSPRCESVAGQEASWRSGYAEDCKSLHPGSISGEASIFSHHLRTLHRQAYGAVAGETWCACRSHDHEGNRQTLSVMNGSKAPAIRAIIFIATLCPQRCRISRPSLAMVCSLMRRKALFIYGDELAAIAGQRRVAPIFFRTNCILRADKDNAAIEILIAGRRVGYIAEADNQRLALELRAAGVDGDVQCRAEIRGAAVGPIAKPGGFRLI